MLHTLVLAVCIGVTSSAIPGDLVNNLPGLTFSPQFKHYSGYLKATDGRMLHYWFVESEGDPSSDPVVLWMNGGPGCSSMDGMLNEHGPFRVSEDGKSINKNPYSWNRIANMLYIEAPAGVGYSYKPDKNYTTSDDQTSLDNYQALKYFFQQYSEFSNNPFFITGESYGGIYVPTLAARVLDDVGFNFKGFAVGNGISDNSMNDNSVIYYGYYHGLWGQDLWKRLVQNCCKDGNSSNCDFTQGTDACQSAVGEASAVFGSLNIYNLFGECYRSSSNASMSLMHPLNQWLHQRNPVVAAYKQKVLSRVDNKEGIVPPCIDASGMITYMNRGDVRKALHIEPSLGTWAVCSMINYIRQYDSMKKQYMKVLLKQSPRILVYNGDADMACNFIGDDWFVDSLNQKLRIPYQAWNYMAEDGTRQVGGFAKQFENLTFITVKGAGHMVPQDKPVQAFTMFTNFITNKDF